MSRPMSMPAGSTGWLARFLLAPVSGYRRWVSPALPQRCRFTPSCSAYADAALRTHGAGRGSWLAARRIARCHPFHPGGVDPVPTVKQRPAPTTSRPSGAHGARPQ